MAVQDELGRRALEHEDYDKWNRVGSRVLSRDGKWMAFSISAYRRARAILKIREIGIARRSTPWRAARRQRFSFDSRYAVYLINPDPEAD